MVIVISYSKIIALVRILFTQLKLFLIKNQVTDYKSFWMIFKLEVWRWNSYGDDIGYLKPSNSAKRLIFN